MRYNGSTTKLKIYRGSQRIEFFVTLTVLSTIFLASGCNKWGKAEQSRQSDVFRVGLVLSTGGLGDKSFNDSAHAGLMEAQEKLGVEVKYGQPPSNRLNSKNIYAPMPMRGSIWSSEPEF